MSIYVCTSANRIKTTAMTNQLKPTKARQRSVKIDSNKPHDMLSKWDGGVLKEQVYEGKYQQGLK